MMNESELMLYKDAAEANSIHASDQLNSDNQQLFDYYNGDLLGNEVDGESQVISTDVYDVVESIMPSLARTFLGHNNVMEFKPLNTSPKEVEAAEQKTIYINELITSQPGSYKSLFDWLKGSLIYKYSALNFGYEEEETVKTVEYVGISDEEFALIDIELKQERDQGIEIEWFEVPREEKDGLRNIEATVKRTKKNYFTEYVNPGDFVITKGATSVSDAAMTGRDKYITKSDLVSMGFSKEIVKDLPQDGTGANTRQEEKLSDQGGADDGNSIHWTGELVKLEIRYLKVDKDEDGISERVKMMCVGDELLSCEPHEIAPYAVLSSIIIPGQLIGTCPAAITKETQLIKSTLLRQTMMNMYQVNSARMAINKNVHKDDLLTTRIGGVVRVRGEENPLNSIAQLPVPFIGDKALMVMQYADAARAQRTGTIPGNAALDANTLNTETATRFKGIEAVSDAKVELMARGIAETGFRDLYAGMLWNVVHFQKEKAEVMALGKPLEIDPRRWLTDQPLTSNVGLGAGDDETVLDNMGTLLQIHERLFQAGSVLTDQTKVYNISKRIVKAMNQRDVGEFFNDPDVQVDTLQAENEQLKQQNAQLEQLAQSHPLAEAENIKAQASLIKAQSDQQTEAAKMIQSQQQFEATMQANMMKFMAETEQKANATIAANDQKTRELVAKLELEYTKIEADTGIDVEGSRI